MEWALGTRVEQGEFNLEFAAQAQPRVVIISGL
jgi:hypothetical protein